MVRVSVFVGIIIELWKVPKVLNFQVGFSFLEIYIFIYIFFYYQSVYQMKHGWV